jgi:hypothetical protein
MDIFDAMGRAVLFSTSIAHTFQSEQLKTGSVESFLMKLLFSKSSSTFLSITTLVLEVLFLELCAIFRS